MRPQAPAVLVRTVDSRSIGIALAMTLPLLAGCLATPDGGQGVQAANAPPANAFGFHATLIDDERTGWEPGLTFAPNGDLFVCSPRGTGSGSDVWRSLDGGASFERTGMDAGSSGPVLRSGGGDLGGGDCGLAPDNEGSIYLVEFWPGSASVAVSRDRGATWSGTPLSILGPMDRPWIATGSPGEVFVAAAQGQGTGLESRGLSMPPAGGIWVARSGDGGLTFPQQVMAVSNEDRLGHNSNIVLGAGNLYLTYAKKVAEGRLAMMVAVSGDRGATWEHHEAALQDFYPGQCFSPLDIFPVVAADDAGGVYLAWVLKNPETQRQDLFIVASADSGKTWNPPVMLADREGTRGLPWITVGSPGHVGVVWYETNVTTLHKFTDDLTGSLKVTCSNNTPKDAEWFIHYAFSSNALDPSPGFLKALVQTEAVGRGELNAGEFPMVAFHPAGRAAVTYVADVPEGDARPVFALQESGPLGRIPSTEPVEDVREGSWLGVAAPSPGGGDLTLTSKTERWNVPSNASMLVLNVKAQDGELHAFALPPGCPRALGNDCAIRFDTEGGNASWTRADPEPGVWGVELYRKSIGAGPTAYRLVIAVQPRGPA